MPAPISDKLVDEIFRLREQGLSYAKIAAELSLNKKTVAGYCNPVIKEKARQKMAEYRLMYPERCLQSYRNSYRRYADKYKQKYKIYYRKNREKLLAKAREYRNRNKEAIKISKQKYYSKNSEKFREYARQYRLMYPERARASRIRVYERKKHLYYARNAARRAQKLKATPPWLTQKHHDSINLMYHLRDKLQENTGAKFHVDHIVPLRAKRNGIHVACGLHVPWNLQVIPAEYNLSKNCNLVDA